MTWELRAMRDDDRAYVFSSWLNSYAEVGRRPRLVDPKTRDLLDEGGEFRGMRRAVYFKLYEPAVQAMVARSDIFVATSPGLEGTDSVLGWMATEGDVVHYVCVKPRLRRLGLAKWLLAQVPIDATYTHAPAPTLAQRLIPAGWLFDPLRRFERKAA